MINKQPNGQSKKKKQERNLLCTDRPLIDCIKLWGVPTEICLGGIRRMTYRASSHRFGTIFTTLSLVWSDDAHCLILLAEWISVEYQRYENESSGRYDTRLFYRFLPHACCPQSCNMIRFSVIEPFHWQIDRRNCERENTATTSTPATGRKTMCNTIDIYFLLFRNKIQSFA